MRSAAFLVFDESLLQQDVHVLRDGEEDAKVVCRADQLASHADGLRGALKWMLSFPPFCLWVHCSKIVVAKNDWVIIFF